MKYTKTDPSKNTWFHWYGLLFGGQDKQQRTGKGSWNDNIQEEQTNEFRHSLITIALPVPY